MSSFDAVYTDFCGSSNMGTLALTGQSKSSNSDHNLQFAMFRQGYILRGRWGSGSNNVG